MMEKLNAEEKEMMTNIISARTWQKAEMELHRWKIKVLREIREISDESPQVMKALLKKELLLKMKLMRLMV